MLPTWQCTIPSGYTFPKKPISEAAISIYCHLDDAPSCSTFMSRHVLTQTWEGINV